MPKHAYLLFTAFLISLCAFSSVSFAQISDIERQDQIVRQRQLAEEKERRQKELERIEKEREQREKEQADAEKEKAAKMDEEDCLKIQDLQIAGSSILSVKDIQDIKNPLLGACFSDNILHQTINVLHKIYQDQGLITTQFSIPKQDPTTGIMKIKVLEGKIETITLGEDKFTDKMQTFTAFGFIEGELLDLQDIHQGLYQINRLPSNDAQISIVKGEKTGYDKLVIKNEKNIPVSGKISYDNLGSDFTGIRRTNFFGTFDNLFALNDQINVEYNANLDDPSNEKDSNTFTGGISIPFTYNTLTYDYSRTEYRGLNPGIRNPIKLSGYSSSTDVGIDRVLINSNKHRLSTTLSLTAKEMASYVNDRKINLSERKLTNSTLSFSFSKYFKNGDYIYLQPQYTRGLKLLNAQKDAAGLAADQAKSQYQLYKIFAILSKTIEIPKIHLPVTFETEMDSQISKDALFGSEQFSVGGYYSVRGFQENFIAGDHGYYFKNKANFNLGKLLKPVKNSLISKNLRHFNKIHIEPFYDYGYAKTKYNGQSGRLSGTGIATIFSGKHFDASVTYSWALHKSNLISSTDKENKMLYFEVSLKPF